MKASLWTGMLLTAILSFATTACASSKDDDVTNNTNKLANQEEGHWVYSVSGGQATLLWGDGTEKTRSVVMIPAKLGGYPVSILGNGADNALANNKVSANYLLLPTSLKTISDRAIYDFNDTAGWVFPKELETIADSALVSCQGGTFYVEEGSPADTYVTAGGKTTAYLTDGNYNAFSMSSGEEGYVQPNGVYLLPAAMLDGSYSTEVFIYANIGYKISSVTVDGQPYDFLAGAPKLNETTILYTFSQGSSSVTVTFEVDPEDTRTENNDNNQNSYTAPAVLEEAVADGAELPEDVSDYCGVNSGTTSKYENTMGISTGVYYAAGGTLYRMVYHSQKTDAVEYYSKAEVINGVYGAEGLVFGQDYDLIRLYNYYEEITSGPGAGGIVALYSTFLYKEVTEGEPDLNDFGLVTVDNSYVNTAALFAQRGADITITNITADVHTGSQGPSEAGNFFGMGSAIHVDGGDASTPATNTLNENTAYVRLVNPRIPGTVNSIYSLASGVLEIDGGDVFSCSSGGHGPYVSTGGQILINTGSTGIVGADGSFNRDVSSLTATQRPARNLGSMTRNTDDEMEGTFNTHDDDVTVIVTGDEAGTTLATDSGGGVILANQVSTRAYGLRSGGVYSIGSNESWVYLYNSTVCSSLDAGLVSASGGYIYAYNSDIFGVMGIKTRSGGNAAASETGITVEYSRVSAYYDDVDMKAVYDVADPADWADSMAETAMDSNQLNIFLDKANDPNFIEESLTWWFMDKSLTPGYSGGNKFAVIYIENSSTPVYVNRSRLVNENYQQYGTLDASALAEGQTPADNLLISVEGGGSGNVFFTEENSITLWDLTGVTGETCELAGDFYLGVEAVASDDPNLGTGSNTLNATFTSSEWTGTVLRGDNTGVINLVFDSDSVWFVTADAIVSDLTLAAQSCISAAGPRSITVAGTLTLAGQVITEDTTVGNVTFVLDPEAVTVVESSGSDPGGDPGGEPPTP